MKVVSFRNVVPAKNKSQEKYDILDKFPCGVNATGDEGFVHQHNSVIECDVAVIQGWQHERGKNAPHLKLRQDIIDQQRLQQKTVCVADSNLFLFANRSNHPFHYLRYSFNGVFPDTGVYFDDVPQAKRWQQISKDLDIGLKEYKTNGSDIVLCLQRDGGWSMGKVSILDWVVNTVNVLRQNTDRKIILRPHPGDKKGVSTYIKALNEIYKRDRSVTLGSIERSLSEDLKNAWAVVNHNSSSIVGPIINGYYAFVTDPCKSQCKDVSNTDLSQIENPCQFDREKWLHRISMFHWKFSELENGSAWAHMRNYVRQ